MTRWIKRQWFQVRAHVVLTMAVLAALASVAIMMPLGIVRERIATRQWIEQNRGQVIYYEGAWELQNKRGRVEASQDQRSIALARKLLGDEKAVLIALHEGGAFTGAQIAKIKQVFPEAGIWYDGSP